ncbi:MAG: hypothetical protein NUW24_02390 [Anaerolineae bacterium]|jgi:hypothetical protein|nr:hypothetical protein [Anaerolineae bacterium]MDH7473851.1 hypothetical protein [Anaerolineae bacterium]
MNIIESLSAGFNTVTKRLWLILVPVALDVYLWLGPRFSIAPVVQRLLPLFVAPPELGVDYQQMMIQNRELLQEMAQSVNLFSLLSASVPGMPALMTTGAPPVGIMRSIPPVWEGKSIWVYVVAVVVLWLAGVFFGSVYLAAIGRAVCVEDQNASGDQPVAPTGGFVSRVWFVCSRVVLFTVLAGILIAVIGFPLSFVLGLLSMLSVNLALIGMTLLMGTALWVSFYLVFVIPAIVLDRAGIWRAIWNSLNVVSRNFWATLGLILLSLFINFGFSVIWQRMNTGSWLTFVAIMGNAYIGTGLMAATFFFYRSRYARWQRVAADKRTKEPPPA